MYNTETLMRIQQLQQLNAVRELTLDEAREVVTLLRDGRQRTAVATAGSRAKKVKEPGKSAEDLLSELDGL